MTASSIGIESISCGPEADRVRELAPRRRRRRSRSSGRRRGVFASPRRTFFRGRSYLFEEARSSAAPSATGSRTSPPAMMPGRQRLAAQLHELLVAVVGDVGCCDLRRAELEADDSFGPWLTCFFCRPRGLRRRRLRRSAAPAAEQVGQLDLLLQVHRVRPPPVAVRAPASWRRRPTSHRARSGRRASPVGSSAFRRFLPVITPRSTRSASDCSIVCMPRAVPVCMTE